MKWKNESEKCNERNESEKSMKKYEIIEIWNNNENNEIVIIVM